ncbi:UDP-2,3-diacylglucosamine diphosphatase LpxI [Alphaproteobacteria bacterium]|nr:UDP-2,3-diacylglucosamine diphosphatase LpxI [Alphaproteobacteria bacterium]
MGASPLGMIAGQGALPLRIAQAQRAAGRDVFILGILNEAEKAIESFPHEWIQMGALRWAADRLKAAGCKELIIIGAVQRPNIEVMEKDQGGQWLLQQVTKNNQIGDDFLLKTVIDYFETQALKVRSAELFLGDLLGPEGQQGIHQMDVHKSDIDLGIDVVKKIGSLDIGQGVVVARRMVLAVEGPEGTDRMLGRVAEMAPELLGTPDEPCGVLVKLPKPQQDRRVDMPTIGAQTVKLAAAAGLAGIVYEAGGALFDDLAATTQAADAAGLFLVGLEASQK